MGIEYRIGDIVYLKTDCDQKERMVISITIRSNGYLYELACGESNTYHYPIEISRKKNPNMY